MDISKIANLSKIELTPEEKSNFPKEFEEILGFIKKIDELDISFDDIHGESQITEHELQGDSIKTFINDIDNNHKENGFYKAPGIKRSNK